MKYSLASVKKKSESDTLVKVRSITIVFVTGIVIISTLERVGALPVAKQFNRVLKSLCLRQGWGLFVNPKSILYWTVPVKVYVDGRKINLYNHLPMDDWKKKN